MENMTEAQRIVAQLLASATLADHLGDVRGALKQAAKIVGLGKIPSGDELTEWLVKNNVTTIYGTEITGE